MSVAANVKLLGQVKDTDGKIVGFKVEDPASKKKYNLRSDFLMENIKAGKISCDGLKVIVVNNKEMLVDQQMLNRIVNKARKEYEQNDNEIMSNKDYDAAYDALADLENKSGYTAPDSATQNVGYEVVSKLEKKKHPQRMMSLDKTKSVDSLVAMLGNKVGVLGWKEDGLTVVLTYENGKLVEGVTRGNGEIGEVVTQNVRQFKNVPLNIKFKGHLVIRGEALISYKDFERINESITDVNEKYKNPRNLCSGSVRQLNSEVTAKRNVVMRMFDLVEAINPDGTKLDDHNSYSYQLDWLKALGFEVVDHVKVNASNVRDAVAKFQSLIMNNPLPSDGLVLKYDDIAYGKSLGNTAKFPRHSIAFKWQDEEAETTLRDIEWSPSRTGLINPVAIFDPVELEGTTVTRAALHNISIMMDLKIGIGDKLLVYKANMIIPQISRNLTQSGNVEIPSTCPCCGGPTEIKVDTNSLNQVYVLTCINPNCPAKGNKLLEHFASRDAMNIEGISESTITKFREAGILEKYVDFYHLDRYVNEIVCMPGFGIKSFQNMLSSVDKSRNVKLANLVYALGIPNVGLGMAKLIAKNCRYDPMKMFNLTYNELVNMDGIGPVIADSYTSWFADPENRNDLADILEEVEIIPETVSTDNSLGEIKVAVHGSLYRIKRTALKELVESMGGKLVTSVNKSTTYLVTNQPGDNTNKVKAARLYNVPIISEDEFIEKFNLPV